MSERRRHPRIDETVKFRLRDESGVWLEDVVNISAVGIKFKCGRKCSMHDVVDLDVIHNRAGLSNVYLRVSGKVVRVIRGEDSYEVALEFIDVSEEVREAISAITSA